MRGSLLLLISCLGITTVSGLSYQVRGVRYGVNQTQNDKVLIESLQSIQFNTCQDPNLFPKFVVSCQPSYKYDEEAWIVGRKMQNCEDLKPLCFDVLCNQDEDHDWSCKSAVTNRYTDLGALHLECDSYAFPTDTYKNILSCQATYEVTSYRSYSGKMFAFSMVNGMFMVLVTVLCSINLAKFKYDKNYPYKDDDHDWGLVIGFIGGIISNIFIVRQAISITSDYDGPNTKIDPYGVTWFICFLIHILTEFLLVFLVIRSFQGYRFIRNWYRNLKSNTQSTIVPRFEPRVPVSEIKIELNNMNSLPSVEIIPPKTEISQSNLSICPPSQISPSKSKVDPPSQV